MTPTHPGTRARRRIADVGDDRLRRARRQWTAVLIVAVLVFVAVLVASINIVGVFAVTRRMLGMFSRGPSTKAAR